MANKVQIETALKVAGYHHDHHTFTRLYVENRISLARAKELFRLGMKAKEAGIKCSCYSCNH